MDEIDSDAMDRLIDDGRLKELAVSLKRLAAAGRGGWKARFWLGRLQARVGLAGEAERNFLKAIRLSPRSLEPRVELSLLLLDAEQFGRLRDARMHLEAALELGRSAKLHLALGRVHEKLGALQEARQDFRRALKLASRSALPRRERAWLSRKIAALGKRPRGRQLERDPGKKGSKRPSLQGEVKGKTLVLDATTRCNQKCLYCFEKHLHFTRPDLTLPKIKAVARRAKSAGFGAVTFIGGEITLVGWLIPMVRFLRGLGLQARIVTNGVVLASRSYVERLMRAGINHIEVSFLSHIPQDDERVGGLKKGLLLRLKGLRHIQELRQGRTDFTLGITVVLTALNTDYLRELIESLLPFQPDRFHFKMLVVTENLKDPSLVPRLGVLQPALASAMRFLEEKGIPFRFEDVPLCLVDPRYYPDQVDVSDKRGFGFRYEATQADAGFRRFAYPASPASPRCAVCALNKSCSGPQRLYVGLFGDEELRPRPRER